MIIRSTTTVEAASKLRTFELRALSTLVVIEQVTTHTTDNPKTRSNWQGAKQGLANHKAAQIVTI
ncbi:TPA: hypothetical protein TUD29_001259 [Streptococcus equi subsp. zooepidemicus]|uniref:hypothetical protein n=1 Tax=Streptococcus equi TaxID=1336 RepID=UPI0013D94E71|nr:hypothetical protein [Streptococcus equi]HEL0221013.1 hypothetical protein [Streptococcus equi subsp. zooepidemicus]